MADSRRRSAAPAVIALVTVVAGTLVFGGVFGLLLRTLTGIDLGTTNFAVGFVLAVAYAVWLLRRHARRG